VRSELLTQDHYVIITFVFPARIYDSVICSCNCQSAASLSLLFSLNINNYQQTVLFLSGLPESGITSKIVIYAGVA